MSFINKREFQDLSGDPAEAKSTPAAETKYEMLPESEKIQIVKKIKLGAEYNDFDIKLYPRKLNFYDFEVFMHDWCITIINPIERKKTIIVNDRAALQRYYNEHKDQIWCGYNSRSYDTFILKAILLGLNPKKVNDDLISRGLKGWQICKDFKKIKLLDFDVYMRNPLKVLEGYMGANICETEVPFDIDRKLTKSEIIKTIKYNIHDVEQTIEVFRRNKSLYDSHIQLIETFKMPMSMISCTQAQLTANILECEPESRDDEFDLKIVDVLSLKKYRFIEDWFRNRMNRDYKKTFSAAVCGVPHNFGWGGVHGAPESPVHFSGGNIYHIDVNSYYPSIMINFDMLTRNCREKGKYKQIYEMRLKLKREGKKKEQAPYKIVLNGTYGICKDRYSLAYDPLQANNICVNGQLMLVDLLEHLEPFINLIQSNTDGLILQIKSGCDKNQVFEICHEWERRTGMTLGFDEIDEIFQKDVNNYIFRFANGKLERKGAYVMELDDLNYDLPIVNKALVNELMGISSIEDTIMNSHDLREFQKVIKISSNYKYAWHNGEILNGKTFRVFASRNGDDSYIGKIKTDGGTIEKYANTPEHCFIVNEDVRGIKTPENLDKRWYVDFAYKRLGDFVGGDTEALF